MLLILTISLAANAVLLALALRCRRALRRKKRVIASLRRARVLARRVEDSLRWRLLWRRVGEMKAEDWPEHING